MKTLCTEPRRDFYLAAWDLAYEAQQQRIAEGGLADETYTDEDDGAAYVFQGEVSP